jgi:large subunit ribosomal protein L1
MKRRGKKYKEKKALVEPQKQLLPEAAIALVKQTARAKFDETIDLSIRLGIPMKKGTAGVRGTIVMPGGAGKPKRVAVLAKNEKVVEAEKAGADVAGSEELIEKIQKGFLDFDVLIATPDIMSTAAKLGKVLGKKGLMPNPKTGTVTFDIEQTVKEFKAGKIEFKSDKNGVINLGIGKVSFEDNKILSNLMALLEAVNHARPIGAKGDMFKAITVSTTMGPGVRIDVKKIVQRFEE